MIESSHCQRYVIICNVIYVKSRKLDFMKPEELSLNNKKSVRKDKKPSLRTLEKNILDQLDRVAQMPEAFKDRMNAEGKQFSVLYLIVSYSFDRDSLYTISST